MKLTEALIIIGVFILIGSLAIYWFYPVIGFENATGVGHSNFSIDISDSIPMQFYANMRYPEKNISYRIEDSCTLTKKDEAERALEILEEATILNFYPVDSGEEIHIACNEKNLVQGGLFVAGEGGPTNITKAGIFNVITHGEVLLIRNSECPNPNVAIHETLHALGFDHSLNSNNIMYAVSNCKQTIGDDIPALIEELYSLPSQPDLVFEDVQHSANKRYLTINMSVRNNGFKQASATQIIIYVDGSEARRIDLQSLDIGEGMKMVLSNLLLKEIIINEIKIEIAYSGEEIDKENNVVVLK